MKIGERVAWILASVAAVALHSSALVAFASLLQERVTAPALIVTFEPDAWLSPDAVAETTVAASVPEVQAPVDAASVVTTESTQTVLGSAEAVQEQAETISVAPSEQSSAVSEAEASNATAQTSENAIGESAPEATEIAPIAEAPLTPVGTVGLAEPHIAETVQEQSGDAAVAEAAAPESDNVVAARTSDPVQEEFSASSVDGTDTSTTGLVAADSSAALAPSNSPSAVIPTVEDASAPATNGPTAAAVSESLSQSSFEPELKDAVEGASPTEVDGKTERVPADQIALLQTKPQPELEPAPPQPPAPPSDIGGTISAYRGGSCFLALPAQTPQGTWQVTSYGPSEAEFSGFDAFLSSNNIRDIKTDQLSIQASQCSAIGLAQTFARSKDESLTLTIANPTVADGAFLQARVAGMERKWVYLLLVDDDGLAQDVSKYAKLRSGVIEIAMPVFVKGGGRERTQLLITISSDAAITLLDLKQPEPLAGLLPLVKGEIAASEAKVSVALSHFQVK